MKHLSDNEKLKKEIGNKLKEFRQEEMKLAKITFEAYAKEADIPVETLKAYEEGERLPEFEDLRKLGEAFCINLNGLIYDNGSLFVCRDDEMEELIQHIEENKTSRYEDYKKLLKSMQVLEMEDFIFNTHEVVVDLVSRINHLSEENPGQVYEITLGMIEGVCY